MRQHPGVGMRLGSQYPEGVKSHSPGSQLRRNPVNYRNRDAAIVPQTKLLMIQTVAKRRHPSANGENHRTHRPTPVVATRHARSGVSTHNAVETATKWFQSRLAWLSMADNFPTATT